MKTLVALVGFLALVGLANADNFASLGYSEDTVIESDQGDQCSGALIYNHDFSFENGYCWQLQGILPPYYGAFGEAYDVGYAYFECVVLWLTQIGYYNGQPIDVYAWDGGVQSPPSGVIMVRPGVTDLNIGFWPACTMNEIPTWSGSFEDFTVGYWADFSSQICQWYVCADENGFGGYPWTNIAPGQDYPTGWQPANVVFPGCISLGIGATITDDPISPVESQTWGGIKALYK